MRPDTAVVFPVLLDEQILMVEDSQPGRDTVLAAPAGRVEEGETPEEAARRELLEETGYTIESLEPLSVEPQMVQKFDWVIYSFIGHGAKKVQEPKLDAGEKIRAHATPFDGLIEHIKHGKGFQRDFGHVFFEAMFDSQKMDALKRRFFS